jgi:hypothetical protein
LTNYTQILNEAAINWIIRSQAEICNFKYSRNLLKAVVANDEDTKSNGPSINAGGDVIGANVRGDKNIIGKNMNITQTNTEINRLTIDPEVLSELDGCIRANNPIS